MKWISYAVCIGLVAVQMSYSMPTQKENLESIDVKMIDDKIQQLTRVVFRVVGRAVLSNGGLTGNGGGGGSGNDDDSSRRISVVLPTYPPDEDEEEEEEEDNATEMATSKPDGEKDDSSKDNLISSSDDDSSSSSTSTSGETRKRSLDTNKAEDNDKAESSQEELSDDIEISETDENSRSKRLGVFGNLLGGGDSSGGEGGSGNFLFDIIRTTADGAARFAGTVYRFIAGINNYGQSQNYYDDSHLVSFESSDWAAQTPVTASVPPPPTTAFTGFANSTLVAGSGATEQQDEDSNGAAEAGHSSDDGYQTGIPGPLTRLFVIANRGFANLVQDLILRLAQTSERLVNFKARLITAII